MASSSEKMRSRSGGRARPGRASQSVLPACFSGFDFSCDGTAFGGSRPTWRPCLVVRASVGPREISSHTGLTVELHGRGHFGRGLFPLGQIMRRAWPRAVASISGNPGFPRYGRVQPFQYRGAVGTPLFDRCMSVCVLQCGGAGHEHTIQSGLHPRGRPARNSRKQPRKGYGRGGPRCGNEVEAFCAGRGPETGKSSER